MTVRLPAESPRRAAARRFAGELQRAMRERGVQVDDVATGVGVSRSAIENYRLGRSLPMLDIAERIADHLDWDGLATIVVDASTQRCTREGCPRTFVAVGVGNRRLYCSSDCARLANKPLGAGRTGRFELRSRLELHAEAVAAFCRSCEPGGMCRDANCELRPVSPLPLKLELPKGRAG